jgi:DNA-binding transcriptional regulator YiaG
MGKLPIHIAHILPAWSKRIKQMRTSFGLSQAEFGKRLNCSPMQVSRWERGLHKPSAACLLALGKMAGPPAGWIFWNLAGITIADVRRMLR